MASALAVHGGQPVRTEPFPSWPTSDDEEAKAVAAVLASGNWGSTHGDVVATFEREFADYQNATHCVCVCNGTLALAAALRAAGVGVGDEVIIPPYTFIATAAAPLFVGAVPVFADIDPGTHLLDAAAVEAAITPRTRAVMPVHVAGRPADMDAFAALSERHGLTVVEDAAQATGAEWRGRRVGALGGAESMGTFSFQTSKNISAGEGGAVVTNSDRMGDALYSIANVGRVRGGGWYQHDHVGYNLRLTEFQAAILRAQLQRHPEQNARRNTNAAILSELLSDVEGVTLPPADERITAHGWHLYLFRVPGLGGAEKRDAFARALTAEGVPCATGYNGLHRNDALRQEATALAERLGQPYPEPEVPVTDQLVTDSVWLPQNTLLGTEEDTRAIADAIAKVLRHADSL
jgi:dTDP-4-amino-4,6-dideoxygalactose transaminase